MSVMIGLLLVLLALPARAVAPPDLSGIRYDQRLGNALPLDARFTDQNGRAVTLHDVTGGVPTVLALGYFACPALCGVVRDDMLSALARSRLSAPSDYKLLFVSIDPKERPQDAQRAFRDDLQRYPVPGADRGWHFLTGDAASVAAIENAVGYHSRYDASLKQFIHPTGIVVANAAGVISGYLLGVGYTPGDLRAAVVRARAGGIERAVQPVLLLCFHFDPTTGRYTLAIIKLLRLAGLLTIATLIGLFILLRRGERAG
jgi:protein SCO1/2